MTVAAPTAPAMLDWQYRTILGELGQLQLHASDPTCPCSLADLGEWCIPKHALNVATLAAETAVMDPERGELWDDLQETALEMHQSTRGALCQREEAPDVVTWAREFRKQVEAFYYHCQGVATLAQTLPQVCSGGVFEPTPQCSTPSQPQTRGGVSLKMVQGGTSCYLSHPAPGPPAHPAGAAPPPASGLSEGVVCLGQVEAGPVNGDPHILCGQRGDPPGSPPTSCVLAVATLAQVEAAPLVVRGVESGGCLATHTRRDQRRLEELARGYMAGAKLTPTGYAELAEYVECLSSSEDEEGSRALRDLAQQLRSAVCPSGPSVGPAAPPPLEDVAGVRRIPLELVDVRPDKYQYRRGGAADVGLDPQHVAHIFENFSPDRFTPIEVRTVDGRYELLSGHHRLAAFKMAGEAGGFPPAPGYNVSSIPALVRDVDEETARALARLSNAQTKEYTPSEFARIVAIETELGNSAETIARSYGNKKVSEIEKFQHIARLPEPLLGILDQPALRRAFTIDHAAVLGKAMQDYGLAAAEVQVMYNRLLTEGEYTANQLERMLRTLGPQAQASQADMFALIEVPGERGGLLSLMRDMMDGIKQEETARRRLRGFTRFIEDKRAKGEMVPPELAEAQAVVTIEIDAIEARIEEARYSLGERVREAPTRPPGQQYPGQTREGETIPMGLWPQVGLSQQSLQDLADQVEGRAGDPQHWLEAQVDMCNLSIDDRDRIWGWKPMREFVAYAVGVGQARLCSIGMVPGTYQVSITEVAEDKVGSLTQKAKTIAGARRVWTPYREVVYEVMLPTQEVTVEELLGRPQLVEVAPPRGEAGEQPRLLQDPLLESIGCAIGGVFCEPESDKPVCTRAQGKKLERCVERVKARNVKRGCTEEGTGSKKCPVPWAVCTETVGCRPA